jgi:hypothetical protein
MLSSETLLEDKKWKNTCCWRQTIRSIFSLATTIHFWYKSDTIFLTSNSSWKTWVEKILWLLLIRSLQWAENGDLSFVHIIVFLDSNMVHFWSFFSLSFTSFISKFCIKTFSVDRLYSGQMLQRIIGSSSLKRKW